ncbi:MAG: Rieske 2Fe-2S domain-containing protein [Gammaproteobacteria bacterium]
MAEFLKVAKRDEIAPGQARRVEVHGKRLALFNVDGNFYALDDIWPLSEGEIAGERVTCPWHGGQFQHPDRRGGRTLPRARALPATAFG